MQQVDVLIVGGGMVGLTLAAALKHSPLNVVLVDKRLPQRPLNTEPELRVSAINQASENLFRRLGVWQLIERKQPYTAMDVREQDSFARIHFDHHDLLLPHLGHIIENQAVTNALMDSLQGAANVRLMDGVGIQSLAQGKSEAFVTLTDGQVISAALVVGTDGANSAIRRLAHLPLTFKDYEHSAIVATVKTAEPHQDTARQVFTPTGPLAFLPLKDPTLCSIVWSQDAAQARQLKTLSDSDFNHALSAAFDNQLGLCEVQSQRVSFPLTMRYVRQWVKERVVVAGDAAHTIHPLAGQGANLGLMDVAALAETLLALYEQNKDIGLARNLRAFERSRKADATAMIAAMEGFKQLFSGTHPLKKLVRGLGMSAVNRLPLAKQQAMRHAAGLAGDLPETMRSPE
ncbi:2-octaprenylphenol hydroxylase [Saliniradius amylolyticus]|uniref:2-octaprenylphenol hydroxylase n=1 Tax=Saliniradius amylolyticus TaxID=2183582 RepID=A0A2S2E1J2_9ALTE|nr:FAD-dependent monooxygenase [Saliniradius amylolyticus]AWL11130.1 2-octaprenylphenol hydroxylase [Saliniradius amylolyticus]